MASGEQRALVRAAVLYYREGYTQAEVARHLGVSRATAGRFLQRARDAGVVRIEIVSPVARQVDTELRLEQLYGLEEAVVLESANPAGHPGVELGQGCAELLERRLGSNSVLGLGWQSDPRDPISHLARFLKESGKPGSVPTTVTVAQLAGALPSRGNRRNPSREVSDVADVLGAREYLIPAPLFVDDPDTTRRLLADSGIRAAIDAAARSDVCLFGVGEVTEATPLYVNGYLSDEDLAELSARGAVGDIAGRFYDADGRPVPGALAERTVGVTLEALARAPMRIATAAGASRVEPLRAAFTGGLANAVVTDVPTAEGLLAAGTPQN
ncbi:sugar-binding transcriptional regulator [Microlunatus soli]|uniref:Deoxyribonucleoside regulator n=1 Tax=Microlunatus soli TaxID=630515 RepID=A0A1H1Z157_9ACTN|nr:sugar-binding domain-containing protein [Microlunatus soli]SDT26906.1 deoxyribonucleoside regulator [Microlunatus soli]